MFCFISSCSLSLMYFYLISITRPRENILVGIGFGIFPFQHKTAIFTTSFSNAMRKCRFYKILLIKCTKSPRENVVVWLGFGIFYVHHKTMRFTTKFPNAIRKCKFYMISLIKFTARPQNNPLVGVGIRIF